MLSIAPVTVGVSTKMYFSHRQAVEWFADVAERVREHEAVREGRVSFFVIPGYLQILPALAAFEGTAVAIGAQDVAPTEDGASTGEVSAVELAELGVQIAEIGHTERRRLFNEDDESTAVKAAVSIRNGLTPLLCVGEDTKLPSSDAADVTVAQLQRCLSDVPPGPIVVAYEPGWAIGASEPAPREHIVTVTRALRSALQSDDSRAGSSVIYGGSAGPGLLTRLGEDVDGLFLGRFAHDPDALLAVLDEAATLTEGRIAA